MTDGEICRSYLSAKNRRKQIGVLAELALRSRDQIIAVLEANGISITALTPRTRKETAIEAAGCAPIHSAYVGKGVRCYVYKEHGLRCR